MGDVQQVGLPGQPFWARAQPSPGAPCLGGGPSGRQETQCEVRQGVHEDPAGEPGKTWNMNPMGACREGFELGRQQTGFTLKGPCAAVELTLRGRGSPRGP